MNRMTPTSPDAAADLGSRAVAWRRHRLLIWALAVSVVLHAMLLLLRVVPPPVWEQVLPAQTLELILVNASTTQAPLQAQALAQANLDGGGLAQQGRATTPLVASPHVRAGDDVQEAEQQVQRLLQEQALLLSQVKHQLARIQASEAGDMQDGAQASQEVTKRKAMAHLLAQIERRIQEENARPNKRYISASTRQVVYALYYDLVRTQIEADGTTHFPADQGQRLYGDLTLSFSVHRDGRVLDAEVLISSGQPALDQATLALVRRQRFAPFDADLRRHADQLGVISTFHFMRDASVRAQLLSP